MNVYRDLYKSESPLWTALHFAAANNKEDMVKLLLQKGADINVKERYLKWSPLHLATFNNHVNIVEFLLQNGASIDQDYGYFLDKAAREGNEDLTKLVLNDVPMIENPNFLDFALLVAAQAGHVNIIKMLIERGANVNCYDNGGTALHYSAQNGHISVVETLLNAGADFNKADYNGQTPLHLAAAWKTEFL